METNQHQPKTYGKALNEGYDAYVSSNSYNMSEYMETDYKAGFSDGWRAAMKKDAAGRREEALRERAAIAAMQGMLAHGTATCSSEFIAGKAVDMATALVNQLKTTLS